MEVSRQMKNSMKKFVLFVSFTVWFPIGCQSQTDVAEKAGEAFYSEQHLDFKKWNRTDACCAAYGKRIAIASGGTHSSKAGHAIFKMGGNIVDAAVAVAFALAVERPHSAGIGGGGFMTLYLKDKEVSTFVDFRETAPSQATKQMYLDKDGKVISSLSVKGPLSIATPGFVVGLYDIHKKWGKLSWKKALEPARLLALKGFPLYPSLSAHIEEEKADLLKEAELKKILFDEKGEPLKVGALFVQQDLAKTIGRIQQNGKEEFISGQTAKAISHFIQERKGIVTLKDMARYRPKFRDPIRGTYKEFEFLSAPPPSAGGVLIAEMLNILSGYSLEEVSKTPSRYFHLLTEVMKRAYADRSEIIGDPDFFKSPFLELTKMPYADKVRETVSLKSATPSSEIKSGEFLGKEKQHTTHLSIIDDRGNAIASTMTINDTFGAALVAPGTGIFLNDEMDDFSAKTGEQNIYGLVSGESNAIAPLKRPVSSMSPTIFLKEGKPVLAVGAAGGSRIISSVLQVSLNYLSVFPGDLRKALFAPRVHHQWVPDKLSLEKGLFQSLGPVLKQKGHDVTEPPWSAIVQAVSCKGNADVAAVFDPRDEGGAEAE